MVSTCAGAEPLGWSQVISVTLSWVMTVLVVVVCDLRRPPLPVPTACVKDASEVVMVVAGSTVVDATGRIDLGAWGDEDMVSVAMSTVSWGLLFSQT